MMKKNYLIALILVAFLTGVLGGMCDLSLLKVFGLILLEYFAIRAIQGIEDDDDDEGGMGNTIDLNFY